MMSSIKSSGKLSGGGSVEPYRSVRIVNRLLRVELADCHPTLPKQKKKKGSRARGLAYEKLFGKFLLTRFPNHDLRLGQWLRFRDINGWGYAQPDAYLVLPDKVLAFECKLTQTDVALAQLGQLYMPLLRKYYDRPVVGVQVCKNLRRAPPRGFEIGSLDQALRLVREHVYTWHWLG